MDATVQEFFKYNDYFIDEKVAFLKFTNTYKVYNSDGELIGAIKESMPAALKALSLIVNKGLFPFTLHILDTEENVLAVIKRGWTFFMSKIEILDSQNTLIARISQKFTFLKPTFTIFDSSGAETASISGDWKAWNFVIFGGGKQIGTITKKWNGILKEAFTTADKYIVSIDPAVVEDEKKIAVVATAITIDMVLKESR